MKRIPIEEATEEQLRHFATTAIGLNIPTNARMDTIQSKLAACYFLPTISVPEDDEPDESIPSMDEALTPAVAAADTPEDPEPIAQQQSGVISANDPKVKLIIGEQAGAGGKRAIPVGVNGIVMLLPRKKPIDVPYRYYLGLVNAVETHFETDETTDEETSSNVQSYPFNVIEMPDRAAILEWHRLDEMPKSQRVAA